MSITLLCPNLRCRAILQVPEKCRGKRVRCGQCGIALAVPAGGGGERAPEDTGKKAKAASKDKR